MTLPSTMPAPPTLRRTARRRTRRHTRHQRRRAPITITPFTTTTGFSTAIIGIHIANAGSGHERCGIDVVAVVGIDDHRGGRGRDGDEPGADAEFGCVGVAGDAHPEVEVGCGFGTASGADVLDGEVFLEALGGFFVSGVGFCDGSFGGTAVRGRGT